MKRDVLTRPFPPELVKQRQGQGGKTLSYVETHAVIARLNEGCEQWSFEIVEHQILDEEVIVIGRLTADAIVKMAFGGSTLTRDRDGRPVSVADDLKSAGSDALKKAASLLGVALELYGAASNESATGRGATHATAPTSPVDRLTGRSSPPSTRSRAGRTSAERPSPAYSKSGSGRQTLPTCRVAKHPRSSRSSPRRTALIPDRTSSNSAGTLTERCRPLPTRFLMATLIELRRAPHTSVSAIKTFLTCPRRYFLHYVLNVRPSFRAAALVFGSCWHETIGKWLRAEAGIDELRQHLRDGLLLRLREHDDVLFDDADQTEEQFIDTAVRMLDVFLARVPRPERTVGAEVAFSMELTHPVTGEALSVPLIGALDAVVVEHGRTAVWELKSAKKKWTRDQLDFDLQATAYGMAARNEGHVGASIEFLITTKGARPDVQRETVVRHHADEEEFVDVALGVFRAVEAGVDFPNRGWQCRTCAFASACRP